MTLLGNDWVVGPDGIPTREAARVVVFDAAGSVLLFHGHDGDDPNHQWWFTVGGGLEPGERVVAAAVRELFEETGFRVSEEELVGPAAKRRATFRFTNLVAKQNETIFLLFLEEVRPQIDLSSHTGSEQSLVDGWRWFSPDELESASRTESVFPVELPALVRRWQKGWDGAIWHLCEADEDD